MMRSIYKIQKHATKQKTLTIFKCVAIIYSKQTYNFIQQTLILTKKC